MTAMICAVCHTKLTWPRDFPNPTYAICQPCTDHEDKRADFSFIVSGTVLLACLMVVGAIAYFFIVM